jgi:hypothetical protein
LRSLSLAAEFVNGGDQSWPRMPMFSGGLSLSQLKAIGGSDGLAS